MARKNKLAELIKDRSAALKQQKELLSRIGFHGKPSMHQAQVAPTQPVAPAPASKKAKIAAVRMRGECIVKLTVDGDRGRRYLVPALRECVDLYLQAAQCGTREVVLLWPGSLECLPLIHALATIECWAQGYKRGLRAVLYPGTSATYRPLNHIYADRGDIAVVNSEVQEVANPKPPAPKQSCADKDVMLYALASRFRDEEIQPCLNELLPHFLLEEGTRSEVLRNNYGATYLSHVVTKLAKRRQKKDLQESTFAHLGAAQFAPDATFAFSYKMTKQQMIAALTTLKEMGGIDVVLLDATRIAFDRVAKQQTKLQNRIAFFLRTITDLFGDGGPGVLIVTNDPRQMTYVRAALNREDQPQKIRLGIKRTCAFRLSEFARGLQAHEGEAPVVLHDAGISVEITDRESSRLVVNAYRLSQQKGMTKEAIDALGHASKFVQMMASLPSAAALLFKSLDENMADDATRRHFDWVALRNEANKSLTGVELVESRRAIHDWLAQASAILGAQEAGTPLARAMVALIKRHSGAGEKVLVVVQKPFYLSLAKEYFLNEPDTEHLSGMVEFTTLQKLQTRLAASTPDQLIVCALSEDLLRWVITTPTLPSAVHFLLTQQIALGAHYALGPVLKFDAFAPYFPRVRAIHDPIRVAQTAVGAVMPEFDYQTPTFTLTAAGTAGPAPGGERGPTDYVEIEVEDARRIYRGRQSRIYVYDPATADSRSLGFRAIAAGDLKHGQAIFIMSEDMRERAEAAFAVAGVVFDEAAKYEALLRQYHSQVRQRIAERFAGRVAEAARAIRDAMQEANCTQEAGNVRYWINLKNAEKTPYDELMPQAPRHFETFRVFMEVLGFDKTMTQVFWDGAVRRVRGTRISDGINLGDHYARVLFDPEGAAAYDRLTPEVLNTLRSSALDSVYEVTAVTLGTTTPRGS